MKLNFLGKFKAMRLAEVLLMSGFFMIGFFFSCISCGSALLTPALLYTGILCYIISVYCLNSVTGYEYDQANPRLQMVADIKKRQYALYTLASLGLSAVFLYMVKPVLPVFAVLSFLLWCLYYGPGIRLKASFLGGTIIHFIAQILHFHLGYLAEGSFTVQSVALSMYFSLILSAGHLHHELLDYEADKANNIQTTTVRLGFDKVVKIVEWLFVLSTVYLLGLYLYGYLKVPEFVPFFVVSLLVILMYQFGLNIRSMTPMHFRLYYRLLFLFAGIVFIVWKF